MGDIETSATAAIKIRLADTDLLSQYINERDCCIFLWCLCAPNKNEEKS